MIYNPDNPIGPHFARSFESAAKPLGIEPIIAHIRGLADIERTAVAQPDSGIFVPLDLTIGAFTEETVATDYAASPAGGLPGSKLRDEQRTGFLRHQSHRPFPPRGFLRRSHLTRGEGG